jgi:bifunctional non-homologous end joining protein LigD
VFNGSVSKRDHPDHLAIFDHWQTADLPRCHQIRRVGNIGIWEIGGVLVSWAIPKGPTLDPSSKRFATMTENHPVEYAEFEGVIPEGHYGAGRVIAWDKGNFESEGNLSPEEQLARGELKILLEGKKLRGAFVLVHMGRHSGKPGEKSRWLLIKRKDQWANSQWNADAPRVARSVLTGRTLEEIGVARRSRKKAA